MGTSGECKWSVDPLEIMHDLQTANNDDERHTIKEAEYLDDSDCGNTAFAVCKDAPLEPANARSMVMCSPFASCFVTKTAPMAEPQEAPTGCFFIGPCVLGLQVSILASMLLGRV